MDLTQQLNETEKICNDLIDILPSKIDRDDISTTSLSALKAHAIRAGLLYRLADISKATISLYKKNTYLPAIVLARSLVETFAVLYYFIKKLEASIESGNVIEIDETLMRILLGDRETDDDVDAISVLTAIDKMDRDVNGIRNLYDSLSEIAHPNWQGTVGYFGKPQESAYSLSFEPPYAASSIESGLNIIYAILDDTLSMDESLKSILDRFTELHEQAAKNS